MSKISSSQTIASVGVVVIAHKQEHAIGSVLRALLSQLLDSDRVCIVIATDAENDSATYEAAVAAISLDAESKPRRYGAACSVQFADHGVKGFNAGANRDQGTSYLLGVDNDLCGIVYIDGDCVPSPTTISGFRNLFMRAGSVPVLGNGLRIHSTTGAVDSRINRLAKGNDVFTFGVDRVALHDRDLRAHRVCWSCLCGMNVPAIQLARKLNHELFGDMNRAFSSQWDGRYGAEDTFLGLSVFRGGGVVVACDPNTVCCEHQDHATKYDTDEAVPNTRKCPEADAVLIRHLQCTSACYVTLHTRAYAYMNRLANQQIRDGNEFYNNITGVDAQAPNQDAVSKHVHVTLSCLGFIAGAGAVSGLPDIPLLKSLATYMVSRVVTYTYGSGATFTDALIARGDRTTVTEYAGVVWRSIRRKVVTFSEYMDAYDRLQSTKQ
jgi:hypothetical protein